MTIFQSALLGWIVVMSQFFLISQGNTGNTYYWSILGLISLRVPQLLITLLIFPGISS